jgi:hypothetical protein
MVHSLLLLYCTQLRTAVDSVQSGLAAVLAVFIVEGLDVVFIVLFDLHLMHCVSLLQHGRHRDTVANGFLKRRDDLPVLVLDDIDFHRSSSYRLLL